MREVQVNKWCDMCFRENENAEQPELALRVPATQSISIGIGIGDGTRPSVHVLDVCDVHAKPIAELAQFVAEAPLIGSESKSSELVRAPRAITALSHSRDTARCPVCAHDIVKSSLINHIWQTHRKDARPQPPQGQCPECGEKYDKPQGLSQHRRHVHGFDAYIDALRGVKGYKITGRERAEAFG